jgi:hypothetical protein
VKGDAEVHLSGYYEPMHDDGQEDDFYGDLPEEDDEDEDFEGEDDDEDEEEDDEEEEDLTTKAKALPS